MTLLGGGFHIGTNKKPAANIDPMDMSLDQLVESRRKAASRGGKPKQVAKKVSNADRSIATGRARRNAKMNARRGIANSDKPTRMQIEKEVTKQARKTQKRQETGGIIRRGGGGGRRRAAAMRKTANTENEKKASARRERRIAGQKAAAARKSEPEKKKKATGSAARVSKKAMNAAVSAMKKSGFSVPTGQQMVISFAPAPKNEKGGQKNQKKNNSNKNTNNNNSKQGGGGRGGGRGRGNRK